MNLLEGIFYMMWRGIAIGVIISAPMGPVGILCVQRTLEKGRRTGFYTGVGAAISDLFYCLVTGFGLSLIEDFLKANQDIIQLFGSIVIAIFGVYLFRSNPSRKLKKPEAQNSTGKRDIIQGFLFTFSNPLIVFLIIGLFARFNFLLPEISLGMYFIGYAFIIAGALGWWWMVTYFVDKVRGHFNLRSMWLINKITGSIIMLFALVGFITAVTGMANAAGRAPVYLNSGRGYGDWQQGRQGSGTDTVNRMFALQGGDFTLSFRASAPESASGRWGMQLLGNNQKISIPVTIKCNPYDNEYQAEIGAAVYDGERRIGEGFILNPSEKSPVCSYRLRNLGGRLTLLAGSREYEMVFDAPMPGWRPDSVGMYLAPGAFVMFDFVSLEQEGVAKAPAVPLGNDFADPDVRDTYFSRSDDTMEGVWQIFDRSFEESKLRVGGDYKLAVASADHGDYALVYLGGAVKNPGNWHEGDLKGFMKSTPYKGVYDVTWLDPSGAPLDGEIKAQLTAADVLTLQFVDHGSSMRLRKVR